MKHFEITAFPRSLFNIENPHGLVSNKLDEDRRYRTPEKWEVNDGTRTGPNEGIKSLAEKKDTPKFQDKPTAAIDNATLAKMTLGTQKERDMAQRRMDIATAEDAGWPPVARESDVGDSEWWRSMEARTSVA